MTTHALKQPATPRDPSPGWWTHVVLVVMVGIVCHYVLTRPSAEGLTRPGARANAFKVMVFNATARPGEPRYGFTTMDRLLKDAPHSGQTFLLPEDAVTLPGHDVHEAKVIERAADYQVIEYRFVNTKSSTGRYKAYRDSVEPLSLELFDFTGFGMLMLPLTAAAMFVAAMLNRLWRRTPERRME